MKNFGIKGIPDYIAPKHLLAIKDTGNRLIEAKDPHDSVGVHGRKFSNLPLFTEVERFDKHLEKLKRISAKEQINYQSICSSNHLKDAPVRFALHLDTNAICEKSLLIYLCNPYTLDEFENDTSGKSFKIFQFHNQLTLAEVKKNWISIISW